MMSPITILHMTPNYRRASFLLPFLFLAGCLGIDTSTNPTRLLILPNPPMRETQPVEPDAGISILIREIAVPAYLHRSDIVVQQPNGTLLPLPFYRWAEPVEDGILRVIVNEMIRLPRVETVRTEFQSGDIRSDHSVSFLLYDLLAHQDGRISIGGNISIGSRGKETTSDTMLRFEISNAWDPSDPSSIAAGYAAVLREFTARVFQRLQIQTSEDTKP